MTTNQLTGLNKFWIYKGGRFLLKKEWVNVVVKKEALCLPEHILKFPVNLTASTD